MGWFTIVMKLFKPMVELMKIAEQMFDDIPDSGEQKKQFVMDAIKNVVEGMTGVVFTEDLWIKIEKACKLVIDAFCLFLFPNEKKA